MPGADEEKARLLRVLESHGQSFLDSFALPTNGKDSSKRKNEEHSSSNYKRLRRTHFSEDEEEEEWHGINKGIASDSSLESDEDEASGESDFEHTDEEIIRPSPETNVTIFSEPGPKKGSQGDRASKAQMKAFMSSNISKLTSNPVGVPPKTKTTIEEEEDRTNAQNDALLHKLVYTKLLSGSLNTELELTPAQRRKALAGRVLELAGSAKLGKGERVVRQAEKNKAVKHVRDGISQKQKEREIKELEQAKTLGNYHPTLKKVFEASGFGPSTRKREKGMKMGVGKFSNGALKLSRNDLKSVSVLQGEMPSNKGRKDQGKFRKKK